VAEPDTQAATIVTVAKDEPYPTGTPKVTDLTKVHFPQNLTDGPVGKWNNPYERQSAQNLAAHGMIAGGAAGT
jgi:hypothetical protein